MNKLDFLFFTAFLEIPSRNVGTLIIVITIAVFTIIITFFKCVLNKLSDNYLLLGSASSTIFVLLDKIFPSFIIK